MLVPSLLLQSSTHGRLVLPPNEGLCVPLPNTILQRVDVDGGSVKGYSRSV